MKKYLFIAFLIITLVACEEKQEEIPSDILSADEMVNITIDMQLLEASFSNKNLPHDSAIFLFKKYEQDLFRQYKITDSTYRKSFNFYSGNPQIMDKIYERVVDSLSLREGQNRL